MWSQDLLKIGIPKGGELRLCENPNITVEVISDRKVKYRGEERWFGEITRHLLSDDTIRRDHTKYWTFGGKCVREMYEEYWNEQESRM